MPLHLLLLLACADSTKDAGDSGGADGGHGGAHDGGHEDCPVVPEGGEHMGEVFATAGWCTDCHSNADGADAMRDGSGAPIGMFDLWQGTMMANAARDPLFRAVVSAEVAAHPGLAAEIEDTCLTCHAPMARTERALAGAGPLGLADLSVEGADAALGLDGVSCTLCHQVQAEGLGTEASFSGGYVVEDRGELYGPHADPYDHPMEMHTGYLPVEAAHLREAELCATCHTLITDTLEGDAPTGHQLVEQAPYLEWRSSTWPGTATCQDCHMPPVDGEGRGISTRIARNPGGNDFGSIDARSPYSQHRFVGGNSLVPAMLRDHADTLHPRASAAALDATIDAVRAQLSTRTASLAVEEASREGGLATVTVRITNQAGHKLPTGHPSRRMWLQARATDATGAVVWSVGQVDAAGRIVDAAGAPLPSESARGPVQPHRDRVDDDAGPQIWQSLMQGPDGSPTFALLSGAAWAKDDRILPMGWAPDADDLARIGPVGTADDPDFVGGSDQLELRFAAPDAVELSVALVYQPVSPRYVAELALHDTPEVAAFLAMWEAAERAPEVLAEVAVDLP